MGVSGSEAEQHSLGLTDGQQLTPILWAKEQGHDAIVNLLMQQDTSHRLEPNAYGEGQPSSSSNGQDSSEAAPRHWPNCSPEANPGLVTILKGPRLTVHLVGKRSYLIDRGYMSTTRRQLTGRGEILDLSVAFTAIFHSDNNGLCFSIWIKFVPIRCARFACIASVPTNKYSFHGPADMRSMRIVFTRA